MTITSGDLLLTTLFAIGLFQALWLSVVLVRKGFNPSLVRLSITILLSIWVLIWPAYENTHMPLFSLSLFIFPLLFALQKDHAFARHLRLCWHMIPAQTSSHKQPPSWSMILMSLIISAELFNLAPELGFGLGLSLCLAWSAAELIDKSKRGLPLNLASNPTQTLAGHLVLVLSTSLLCAWSLQLYHDTDWQLFLIATLIVGCIASMTRALVVTGLNMPLATLAMAITLWLL